VSARLAWALLACVACAGCDGSEPSAGPHGAAVVDAGRVEDEDEGFVGCPDSIPTFALGMHARGDGGRLGATLVAASPAPPLRYLNDWTLTLTLGDGTPLPDAVITKARAFMPVHGHDGIVVPTLEMLPEPGRVRIRGLNFNMRGPWQVQLSLSSPSTGDDYVVFYICVQE